MAFPSTYNFNYYKGDTMEFRIYPKKPDGNAFDLEDYNVAFTISDKRGSLGTVNVSAYSVISADNTYITCAIRPDDSLNLVAGTPYVYDIEVRSQSTSPYKKVFTLMTGTISVTDQITNILNDVIEPGPATGFVETTVDDVSVVFSWTAPTVGDSPTSYTIVYGTSLTNPLTWLVDGTTTSTTYTLDGLDPETTYYVGVLPTNAAGPTLEETVAAILAAGSPTGILLVDPVTTTIERPGTPTNLVTTPGSDSVSATWTAPATGGTPSGYHVVVSTNSDFSVLGDIVLSTDVASAAAAIPAGLTPETTYYVAIVPFNASGHFTLEEAFVAYAINPATAPVLLGFFVTGAA